MWVVHLILCFLTGGLWLIPLMIYYLIKLFGGSITFLDNYLPKKFTKNGVTKSFWFNPITDYIEFGGNVELNDYDSNSKSYGSVIIHTTSKPQKGYNLFSGVITKIQYTITFKPINSNSTITNKFEVIVYPNDNGVCDDKTIEYLSIRARKIEDFELNITFADGRVTIPPKIQEEDIEEENVEEVEDAENLEDENMEEEVDNIEDEKITFEDVKDSESVKETINTYNNPYLVKLQKETEMIEKQIELLKLKKELEDELNNKKENKSSSDKE